MGKFLELYNQDALIMAKSLRLQIQKSMDYMIGFPVWLEGRFVNKVLWLGKDLVVFDERMTGRFVKERYVREIYRVLHPDITPPLLITNLLM